MPQQQNLLKIQTLLLNWYADFQRTFVWRHENPDPYIVLVSETMLQQTQTSRVEQKLPEFLKSFPTIFDLAKATNAEIIRAWQGMGYNSRALRLRDCGRAVVEIFSGEIPSDETALLKLPGIGDYTARALQAFAFKKNVTIVDVNIRRVYSRLLKIMLTTASVALESDVRKFAGEVYPKGKSSEWHQAVMDLGATICTARAPKCLICPMQNICPSAFQMKEEKVLKRAEPSHRGLPNRIWRGKSVEILRGVKEISGEELLSKILKTTPNAEDSEWFQMIIKALEKDKIIATRVFKNKIFVKLAE
ncbi:MAG: A/G-specific adenine glycosylase [Bacteroidota bacterium]